MPITERMRDDVAILDFTGEFDHGDAGAAERAVIEAVNNGAAKIVLHFGGVTFMDRNPAVALYAAVRFAEMNRSEVKLVAVPPQAGEQLDSLLMHHKPYDSEDAAIKSFD